jgi:hypothetical protein
VDLKHQDAVSHAFYKVNQFALVLALQGVLQFFQLPLRRYPD